MTFYNPKYYAALRAQRRKLTSAQARGNKLASPEPRAQAARQKQQAPGSSSQGPSAQARAPGRKQQG